ncbi:MAG: hypothetical protein QOI05_4984 [Bradyrhizobium sp.]|jgi:hypothetical protein|nr:hypothetical protein [Bradyrhizobium sp.]
MTDQYPNDLQPGSPPGIVFEKWKSVIGIMAASIIAYATMLAMWIFWRDIQDRNLENTGNQILALIGTLFILMLLYICTRIVVAALSGHKEIVRSQDRRLLEPLIEGANEKAIDQYVRLSSLTGVTGVATKLGLTGLPLITVALTLIFAGLELYKPSGGFMDLTKLTLGAFIGSFVQRTATSQAVAASGRIPLT